MAAHKRPRILIVDDENQLANEIKMALQAAGFLADVALDANTALTSYATNKPNLVLMDVMLPNTDGYKLGSHMMEKFDCPVIFISALGADANRIKGLELGAEDYLAKPFSTRELILRVKKTLARNGSRLDAIELGNTSIDVTAGVASVQGKDLGLTSLELAVLSELAEKQKRVLSKTFLLSQVWGYDAYDPNTVEVHVSALRRKLAAADSDCEIQTRRSLGYILFVRRNEVAAP